MEKAQRFESSGAYDPMKAKFLRGTLQEEGEFIVDTQDDLISEFLVERTGNLRQKRGFSVEPSGEGFRLSVHSLKYLRFRDMKVLDGRPNKVKIDVHNSLIYGRLSSIASQLQFGYTDEMKELMSQYYDNLQIKA